MKQEIIKGYNREKEMLTERLIKINQGNSGRINEASPVILSRIVQIDQILLKFVETVNNVPEPTNQGVN